MPIRRTIKNMVRNYTDNEVKVREATSNDPWGPSSTLMSEIADLTHNAGAFSEIMSMIWKRLNDKNKNWRHVYKSLVLLEYIIKTGSEKVAQQCKQNIFAIQTLKDFQYIEDNKDHGMNVREKAKYLVSLIADEERLKVEREKALNAKKRLAETPSGISSNNRTVTFGRGAGMSSSPSNFSVVTSSDRRYTSEATAEDPNLNTAVSTQSNPPGEIDSVRPQTEGEEELQLQLALAMSREEHEQEEKKRRDDEAKEELKLKMALEESQREEEASLGAEAGAGSMVSSGGATSGNLFNLVDTSLSAAPASAPDPWSSQTPNFRSDHDPWGASAGAAAAPKVPSAGVPGATSDPWGSSGAGALVAPDAPSATSDPWAMSAGASAPVGGGVNASGMSTGIQFQPAGSTSTDDDFAALAIRTNGSGEAISSKAVVPSNADAWSMEPLGETLAPERALDNSESLLSGDFQDDSKSKSKSPSEFLGENANLVNLDNLLPKPTTHVVGSTNPFATSIPAVAPAQNPFAALQPPKVPLNQLMAESKQAVAFNSSLPPSGPVGNPWAQQPSGPPPGYPMGVAQPPLATAQPMGQGQFPIQSSNPFL